MIKEIDGAAYAAIVHSGLCRLEKHKRRLNDLNVFPVPDGDTGTNMVMTLKHGYDAIKEGEGSLPELSRRFSASAVFGARGNSGVIVSQFFKGMSEVFSMTEHADAQTFSLALKKGCDYAYAAVANPVEGTILTVIKDASRAVAKALPLDSIDDAVAVFLQEARLSLDRTPELLPILKKANVVDSGGSGIVYFFEGVARHLSGAEEEKEAPDTEEATLAEPEDFSIFNKNTVFSYGYCFEGLIQLRTEASELDLDRLKDEFSSYGESTVLSPEGDKLKLHIHTKRLGGLIDRCQRYGELLTVKIENMSVQNIRNEMRQREAQKFLYDPERTAGAYAMIAVAPNLDMQRIFLEMGADVVILSDIAPSAQDFMDAFRLTEAKDILVFPNSANSILTSMQAGSLYKGARVTVLNSRSVPDCYTILPLLDIERTADAAVRRANAALSSRYRLSVYHATKDVQVGERKIRKNDFFSLADERILAVRESLEAVTLRSVEATMSKKEYGFITLFYGKYISAEYMEHLLDRLSKINYDVELAAVSTMETAYDITILFE